MTNPDQAPRADAERNRRQLLDAATAVLRDNPGASMDEIAQGAQLTRVTLYRHFGGRKKLLDAIRDEALAEAAAAVQSARLDEGTSVEALTRFVSAATSRGDRFQFLLTGSADLPPDFLRRRGEALAPLLNVISRGRAAGEIRADLPAEWVTSALISLLTTAVGRPGPAAEESAELVVTTLLRGVAAAD